MHAFYRMYVQMLIIVLNFCQNLQFQDIYSYFASLLQFLLVTNLGVYLTILTFLNVIFTTF